jgi:hypothetical protein
LLPAILAEGFSTLPPLTVPGKTAWMNAVQAALAEDPAWEVPGRPSRALPPPVVDPDEDDDDDTPPPRRKGRMVLALAVAGICGLGLAGGMLLWADAPPRAAESTTISPPALAALPESRLAESRLAEPNRPSLPPIEQVSLPVLPPLMPPVLPDPTLEPAMPEAPMEETVEEAAAEPEAAPPPPRPRRASAPRRPRIDPGCSAALFRFQQGLPLNATDAAHVRNGCATSW